MREDRRRGDDENGTQEPRASESAKKCRDLRSLAKAHLSIGAVSLRMLRPMIRATVDYAPHHR